MPRTSGGHKFHKNPDCPCNACKARRRTQEALALAARDGGAALAALEEERKRKIADHRKDSVKKLAKINTGLPPIIARGDSMRDRVAQWAAYRMAEPGIKTAEVAKRLGINRNTLQEYIHRASKEGWLKFEDPFDRIDQEIVPKVLDNLNHFLDAKDRTVTIESAKNTIFKTWLDDKGVNESKSNTLALQIQLLPPENPKTIEGHVVGAPRLLEGEVT